MAPNEESVPVLVPGLLHLQGFGAAVIPLSNSREKSVSVSPPVNMNDSSGLKPDDLGGDQEEERGDFSVSPPVNMNDSSGLKPDDLGGDQEEEEEEIEEAIDNGSDFSVFWKEGACGSLLSEFDDFVANEKHGAMVGASRALRCGFEIGDMVWGKVKSHPWWPGLIFYEGFASSSVRRTRREGHVLVAFFGDSSYGWFDPAELIPFEDNFEEKAQQTNAKQFVEAVDEAVDEARRRSSLGLLCKCRTQLNLRSTGVGGYFAVDVPDFELNALYSEKQIVKYREDFQPAAMLDFVKHVAAVSREIDATTLDFVRSKATAFAFRRAAFEEFVETYEQAFGPSSSSSSKMAFARAPLSGPLVIAEALSEIKNSKTPFKLDHLKQGDGKRGSSDEVSNNCSHSESVASQERKCETLVETKSSTYPEEGLPEKVLLNPHSVISAGEEDGRAFADRTMKHSDGIIYPKVPDQNKILKRGLVDSGSDVLSFRAKKRKKILTPESISSSRKNLTGKTFSVGLASSQDPAAVLQKKNAPLGSYSFSGSTWTKTEFDVTNTLKELHSVALESFDGVHRKISSFALQFLLRFRSLNYQKSLAIATSSNAVSSKPPGLISGPKKVVRLIAEGKGIAKQEKTLSGKKQIPVPFDRQEETAAKKFKKIEQTKSPVVSSQKPVKQNLPKQQVVAQRSNEPTMLLMRFPPHTSLPSGAELKAKFARFGSIDLSAIRVLWKSSTCRVVFRQKRDAEAAYKYAIANTSLFGNLDVRYSVKELGTPILDAPEIGKGRDGPPSEPTVKDPLHSGPLKSILKKPSSGGGKVGRRNRVKFLLAGEESGVPSYVPPEFISNNVQKPPLLPLPRFGKSLLNNPTPPPPPPSTDISKQMLSLLTRCNDVVSTISGVYGYAPYHPL